MFDYFIYHLKKLALLGLILFVAMIGGFVILFVNFRDREVLTNPGQVYDFVMEHRAGDRYFTETNRRYLQERKIWAIYIDNNGVVADSAFKPSVVPDHYNLQDIAKFSRFYLKDYPVFTYVAGEGLMVFGYARGSFDKLPVNYYNFNNLMSNVKLSMGLLVFFIIGVYSLYRYEIKSFTKRLRPLEQGIDHLYDRDFEPLPEGPAFKELAHTINQANRRYMDLSDSRAKWIRGVSHDIRTPLAKLNWHIEAIKETEGGTVAREMESQVMKISRLIEDLNLTMRLDTLGSEELVVQSPLPPLRSVIVDAVNAYPERTIDFKSDIQHGALMALDAHLFQRMIDNVLKNALIHTDGDVVVTGVSMDDQLLMTISDEGEGIDDDVIIRLASYDASSVQTHGMGLFIARQIANLHGGEMTIAKKSKGTDIIFTFPLAKGEKSV